jgi:hypothetical protein
MSSASSPSSSSAREDLGSLPPLAGAAFPPGRGCLLGGAREPSATGGKRRRAAKQADDSNNEDDSSDSDSNGGNSDNDDADDDDDAGGGSARCPAKKTACPRSAACAGSAAKGAATGQGAGGGSSKKRAQASRDPHGKKAKRAARATPALTEEQKAAAFAERVAKCCGILPPHATNWGLGEGIRLPDPDPKGTWRHGHIRILDEVLNKYGPLLAGDQIPCVVCFRRINEGPWHECHVQQGHRVCD